MHRARIGELLLDAGLVAPAELQDALFLQTKGSGLLGQLLVRIGALSEADLLRVLAAQLALPILTADDAPTPEVLAAAIAGTHTSGAWWAAHHAVFWWEEREDLTRRLVCAAANPLDLAVVEQASRIGGSNTAVLLASRSLIEGLHQDIAALDRLISGASANASDAAHLRELAQETPVIDFVNGVFSQALALRASDIHVEPYQNEFLVRMRIDGVLSVMRTGPRASFDAVCSRLKLLSGMDIGERRLPQDGRQSIRVSGRAVDLRVSSLPSSWGESLVLRLLGKSDRLPELVEMGLDPRRADALLQLAFSPSGVILVTGPTGSGKTTTIYRLLQHLNDGVRKIVTVEDPVEFDLPGAVQVGVRNEVGLSFAAGLRSILRQDPDVIMVGEIRDGETARIAVQAALTGHLVISTVHTNSALGATTRLMNLGVEPFLLTDVLRALVGQRLIRRLCEVCAKPAAAALVEIYETLRPEAHRAVKRRCNWREPVGCPACAGSGYLGRVGLFELVASAPALQRAVREPGSESRSGAYENHLGLLDDGYLKASQGLTTLAEVRRVAGDIAPPSA